MAWQDSRTPLAPAGPGAFPPETQLAVITLASSKTAEHDRPDNGWTLDEIAAAIVNEAHAEAMSRATIWRILDAADLKPHRSVYWLNSHDPDFEANAKEVCQLYVNAPRLLPAGAAGALLRREDRDADPGPASTRRGRPSRASRRSGSSSTSATARGR